MPLFGPKFPLKTGNHDTFELYEDVESQIGFYLKNLLLTSPGENISDPNYGVGLRRYLFEQNVGNSRGSMKSKIFSQISRYLPYLTSVTVEVGDNENENIASVRVTYSIPGDVTQQVFDLDITPDNNIGFY